MRHSFRFSGTGGQGLITAGIILAEAALLERPSWLYNPNPTARKPAAAPPRPRLSSVMSPFTSAVLSARILCW